MNLIPFGEVTQDRYEISKKYCLIEKAGPIWRLTQKCKNAYDPTSYVFYLQGKIDKPKRTTDTKSKSVEKPEQKLTPQQRGEQEMRSKEFQDAVDELFKL